LIKAYPKRPDGKRGEVFRMLGNLSKFQKESALAPAGPLGILDRLFVIPGAAERGIREAQRCRARHRSTLTGSRVLALAAESTAPAYRELVDLGRPSLKIRRHGWTLLWCSKIRVKLRDSKRVIHCAHIMLCIAFTRVASDKISIWLHYRHRASCFFR
jgi:hypothetical protein